MPDLPAVVLDACVLIPSRLRDCLLSLAAAQCFRPVWNDVILAEVAWKERDRHQRFGLSQTQASRLADRVVAQMSKAFDDSMVEHWERLDGTFGLPDPTDEHVVATAVVGHASVIVTDNLVDFPASALPVGIQAITPADFTARIAKALPGSATTALLEMSARLRNPTMSPSDLLDYFDSHYQMNETTALLRPWIGD